MRHIQLIYTVIEPFSGEVFSIVWRSKHLTREWVGVKGIDIGPFFQFPLEREGSQRPGNIMCARRQLTIDKVVAARVMPVARRLFPTLVWSDLVWHEWHLRVRYFNCWSRSNKGF